MRLQTLALTALDTGLRVAELLALQRSDVDWDNFTLKVRGKGGKHRLVPISLQLRKALYRHLQIHTHSLLFCSRVGAPLGQRDLLKYFKAFCRACGVAGVRTSFHTLRHTFAVSYLRAGGNLEYLRRILGHSSITTTKKYLRSLEVEDVRQVHDGLSPLSLRSR